MKKIMFNDKYGLTDAVLEGRKTMTRRIATTEEIECPNIGWGIEGKERGKRVLCSCSEILAMSRYSKGEVVAIAQSYKSIFEKSLNYALPRYHWLDDHIDEKGYANKMFVKAGEMPHHIKITDIKVERLQDISDEDCLKEGIKEFSGGYGVKFGDNHNLFSNTPRTAFAALIDKVSGKGTWENNPWVFAYEFELIKTES